VKLKVTIAKLSVQAKEGQSELFFLSQAMNSAAQRNINAALYMVLDLMLIRIKPSKRYKKFDYCWDGARQRDECNPNNTHPIPGTSLSLFFLAPCNLRPHFL
jgi:hypothetical protein